MKTMFRRTTLRTFAVLSALAFTLSAVALHAQDGRGRKYKAPPATSRIDVTVVRAGDQKPIEDAAVVFHPIKDGKDAGNMELKTNEDGKTYIDVIETGSTVLVQIIAHGYQTYGKEYKVDKPELALTIPLSRPVPQYSVYKDHPNQGQNQDQNQQQKPDTSKPQ
jgi:hypothetical protein